MNEEEKWKLVGAKLMSVESNILAIRAEAEFALQELKRLDAEGLGSEDMSQAREALYAIRVTATYDVMGECATLMQKLGVGPMNDPDAKGPPSVNAKFIVSWLFEDLRRLHGIIQAFESKSAGAQPPESNLERHLDILVFLLMEAGVQMYQAWDEIHNALTPLLEDRESTT